MVDPNGSERARIDSKVLAFIYGWLTLGEVRRSPMSSATPSHPAPLAPDDQSVIATWIDRFVSGVRATAFWSAAVLPLFVIGALVAGPIGQYPTVLAGMLALNVVCAVIGHAHTPRGDQS